MTEKCTNCGGYVHSRPFYCIKRPPLGVWCVWVCPKCGHRIEKWSTYK